MGWNKVKIILLKQSLEKIEQQVTNLTNEVANLQKLLREHLQLQGEQPQPPNGYGPHNFKPNYPPGSDAISYDCSCGAYYLGVGNNCGGSTFHPAPDPLPDPKQCRLNPL